MRNRERKTRLIALGGLLSVALMSVATTAAQSATANRPNGACPKVGAKATIKGKTYVCNTVIGKRIWQLPVAATTPPPAAVAATTISPAKADSWADVIENAKKEGKVMIYSSQDPVRLNEIAVKFKAKYGITMEIYRDVDANLIPKVEAEKSTGKGIADVLAQAGAPWQSLRDSEGGWFVPVAGPAFSASTFNRAANLSKSGSYFTSTAAILTFGWNTKLFPKGLKDYTDLLDPSLAGGKIGVIDPGGSAAITDFYLYLEEKYGASFIAKLAAQRPRIYVSSLPMKAAVASGEIAAGSFIPPPLEEKLAGAPIDWGLSDTVWGARFNTAVLKSAPHPNAAQLLSDYLVSEEAQTILAKASGSVYPGIGLMTTDKVRIQNVAKLSQDQVNAFTERWRIMFT